MLCLDPGQGNHNRSELTHMPTLIYLREFVYTTNDWDCIKEYLSIGGLSINWKIIIENTRKYPLVILTLSKIQLVQE